MMTFSRKATNIIFLECPQHTYTLIIHTYRHTPFSSLFGVFNVCFPPHFTYYLAKIYFSNESWLPMGKCFWTHELYLICASYLFLMWAFQTWCMCITLDGIFLRDINISINGNTTGNKCLIHAHYGAQTCVLRTSAVFGLGHRFKTKVWN